LSGVKVFSDAKYKRTTKSKDLPHFFQVSKRRMLVSVCATWSSQSRQGRKALNPFQGGRTGMGRYAGDYAILGVPTFSISWSSSVCDELTALLLSPYCHGFVLRQLFCIGVQLTVETYSEKNNEGETWEERDSAIFIKEYP